MTRIGSLFSGIGGLELGLERAELGTVAWHCEADPHCRAVLAARWPDVPCFPDVRELRGVLVEPVEILSGGFPCQDLSLAGLGKGLDGERSGLWSQMKRLVEELRPQRVVAENVGALLSRGLDRVLGDLCDIGYAAEWQIVEALAVGALHRRARVFIVAYPDAEDAAVVFHDRGRHLRQVFAANRAGIWWGEPDGLSRTVLRAELAPRERRKRLHALGNAVVPQCSEVVGWYIATAHRMRGQMGWPLAVRSADGWISPQRSLFGDEAFRDRLPRAGLMRSGVIYARAPMVGAGEAMRWHLDACIVRSVFGAVTLPTPAAVEYGSSQNGVNASRPSAGTPSLATMARHGVWPTPTASDADGGPGGHREGGPNLRTSAMFPTPTASMETLADMEQARFAGDDPRRPSYREAALLPTPRASDAKAGSGDLGRGTKSPPDLTARASGLAPTPTASDATSGPNQPNGRRGRRLADLSGAPTLALWPTPTAEGGTGYRTGDDGDVWRPTLEGAVQMAPGGPPPVIVAALHRHLSPDEVRASVADERSRSSLPTPQAHDARSDRGRGSLAQGGGRTLTGVARGRLMPTPTATDGNGSRRVGLAPGSNPGVTLTDAVQPVRATPRASDVRSGQVSAAVFRKNSRPLCEQVAQAEGLTPKRSLSARFARVRRRWRPPTTRRERPQLNPAWVCWLMGFPAGWPDT